MEVIPLLVLCSLALAAGGALMFWLSARLGDHEHADRLSLLPLEDDDPRENDRPGQALRRHDGSGSDDDAH